MLVATYGLYKDLAMTLRELFQLLVEHTVQFIEGEHSIETFLIEEFGKRTFLTHIFMYAGAQAIMRCKEVALSHKVAKTSETISSQTGTSSMK